MKHLLYISSAASGLTTEDVRKILAASWKNNKRIGVTGILLFGRGAFLQLLEGGSNGVDYLFGVIEKDPRHTDVTVLQRSNTSRRIFGDWQMAAQALPDEGKALGLIGPALRTQLSKGEASLMMDFVRGYQHLVLDRQSY